MLVTISLLAGALLGQRFRVLALIPAIIIVLAGSGIMDLARGLPHVQTFADAIAAAVGVQVGYLAGATIGYLLVMVRSRRMQAHAAVPMLTKEASGLHRSTLGTQANLESSSSIRAET